MEAQKDARKKIQTEARNESWQHAHQTLPKLLEIHRECSVALRVTPDCIMDDLSGHQVPISTEFHKD